MSKVITASFTKAELFQLMVCLKPSYDKIWDIYENHAFSRSRSIIDEDPTNILFRKLRDLLNDGLQKCD